MTTPQSTIHRRRFAISLVASIAVHVAAVLLVLLLAAAGSAPTVATPHEAEKLEAKQESPTPPSEDFKISVVELPPPPDQPKPPVPPPRMNEDLKVVEQKTNELTPEVANFRSERANRVDKDQRAPEVTTAEVEPDDANPQRVEDASDNAAEERAQAVESPDASEEAALPPVDVGRLFATPLATADAVLGKVPDDVRRAARAKDGRRRILSDFEARDKAFRGALENFISEVEVGNHTGVNAYGDVAAAYLSRIHRKIHVRWAEGYLLGLDTGMGRSGPLANPSLNTKLEFVIDGETGNVEKVNIVKGSGQMQYDAEAIIIGQTIGPHGPAPKEIVSPNGKVYVHWNFWRDSRQCGTFGASVFIVNKDG